MMLKKLTGKTISLILAVLMLVTLMPFGASATSTATDLSEPLEGFTAEQLQTTYTKDTQFSGNDGFLAPAFYGSTAVTLENDAEKGGVLKLSSDGTGSNLTSEAGFANCLSLGASASGATNDSFTFKISFKRSEVSKNMYIYLSNGRTSTRWQMIRLWGNAVCINNTSTGLTIEANTWYDFTVNVNMTKKIVILEVDGGKYDHARVINENSTSSYQLNETQVYNSIMMGWISAGALDNTYNVKIGNMSIETGAVKVDEVAHDSKLTFENGTLATRSATDASDWSNGAWSIDGADIYSENVEISETLTTNINALTVVDSGDYHGNVLKKVYNKYAAPINNALTEVDATAPLVVETSFKEVGWAQINKITLTGTDAESASKSLNILAATGTATRVFKFCGIDGTANGGSNPSLPNASSEWYRLRIIIDLAADTIALSYWPESNPADVTTISCSATEQAAIAEFATLTNVSIAPYARYVDGQAMYLDDMRVYQKTALSYTGSVPANNAVEVSSRLIPEISFNMPLQSTSGLTAALVNVDNNSATVTATVSLNKSGNGIMVTPNEELKPMTNYTLTVNGTATDIFGQTLNISKTISFATDDIIDINSVTFTQGGVPVDGSVAPGELTATVDITSCDGEARDIFVLLGLYNKANGELEAFDVVAPQSTADYDETLTVTVPDDDGITYEPKVFIWNNYSGLKPYVAPITLD